MTKTKIAILFIFFASRILVAQTEETLSNSIKAHSVSIKLLGSPTLPLGISYGQMLSDRLSMEMGVGVFSFGAGVEYYITNPRKHRINLNTGIYGSYDYNGFPMIYLPLGVSYLGKNHFQYNLNVGLLYAQNENFIDNRNKTSPWFGLTISKRFGQDIETLMSEEETDFSNVICARLGFVFPFVGINYERLLNPNLGLEATIGLIGASAGVNVYFSSIKPGKLGFKSGLSQGISVIPLEGIENSTYMPIGFSYLASSSFVFSVDFGPQYWYSEKKFLTGFSVKIGKAF